MSEFWAYVNLWVVLPWVVLNVVRTLCPIVIFCRIGVTECKLFCLDLVRGCFVLSRQKLC